MICGNHGVSGMEGRVNMFHRPAISASTDAPAGAAGLASAGEDAIVVDRLSKTFGDACCALRDVSLRVYP
jgi:hypothetical protein